MNGSPTTGVDAGSTTRRVFVGSSSTFVELALKVVTMVLASGVEPLMRTITNLPFCNAVGVKARLFAPVMTLQNGLSLVEVGTTLVQTCH